MILIGDIGNTQSKFAYYNKGNNKIFKLKNFNTSNIEKNKDFLEEASTLKNDYVEDSKLAFILYGIGMLFIIVGRVLINNKLSGIGNVVFIIGIIIPWKNGLSLQREVYFPMIFL